MSNSRHAAVSERDKMMLADPNLPVAHDNGSFISEKISRLVECIRDYSPRLDVKWIPYDRRSPGDPEFLIVEKTPDGAEHPVFFVHEKDFDGSVLERIILSDNNRTDVHSNIEAQNEAVRRLERNIVEDKLAEARDMMAHAIRSGKFDYTVRSDEGKTIKVDSHGAQLLKGA